MSHWRECTKPKTNYSLIIGAKHRTLLALHRSQAAKVVLRCAGLRYIIRLNFCTHFAINANAHRNISIEFLQFKVLILLRLCYAQTVAKSNFSPELFRSLILLVMFIEKVCSYSCEKPVAFANFLFYFASFTSSKSGIALCWAQVYYTLEFLYAFRNKRHRLQLVKIFIFT